MQTTLRSQNLSCPSCVGKIEGTLSDTTGVEDATVHFTTGRIEIEHDPDRISEEELAEIVQEAGYEAEVSAF